MRKLWLVLPLYGAAIAFQQVPIPEYPGDPDTGAHKGQPIVCMNYNTKIHSANCNCKAMREEGDSCKRRDEYGPDTWDNDNSTPRCKTHCRKTACQCNSNCDTQEKTLLKIHATYDGQKAELVLKGSTQEISEVLALVEAELADYSQELDVPNVQWEFEKDLEENFS